MQLFFNGINVSACNRRVIVFDNEREQINYLIKYFQNICLESISARGYMTAGLSGGETPVWFYHALAEEKKDIFWENIHVFPVDERFVPFTDKDSNFGMINEALLKAVSIPQENVHPVLTSEKKPETAASEYEEELIRFFKLKPGRFPEFDFLLLGIGEDGHTASLFPGSAAFYEMNRLACFVNMGMKSHDRITMTIPVINNSRNIVFLVKGERKAEILKRVIMNDKAAPASAVNPVKGSLVFIADRSAAKLLSK